MTELNSRCDIMLDNYCKTVIIEANTMSDMVRKQILPAVTAYAGAVATSAGAKKAFAPSASVAYETKLVEKLSMLTEQISDGCESLEQAVLQAGLSSNGIISESYAIRDLVLPKMATLRAAVDEAETLTDEKYWGIPSYCDLLFGVK